MNILLIINGSAYGLDATYNAIRLANSLAKREGTVVTVFLMGDGVSAAVAGQKTPDGYYNLGKMLLVAKRDGADVALCGTCMDARGITEAMVVEGSRRSTMQELTDLTLAADKVLVF